MVLTQKTVRQPDAPYCKETFGGGFDTHVHLCEIEVDDTREQHTWTAVGRAQEDHLVAQLCPLHRGSQ